MTLQLKKNEQVYLAIGATRREKARIKDWLDNGCVCLAFDETIALRPGTQVQLEIPDSHPRTFFYMQAVESLSKEKTELYLSRNVNTQFDHRRVSWRVPYTAKTVIRGKDKQHFVDAEFTNISMEAAHLLSTDKFAVGTDVELRLVLPEYPEHTVTAHVMRLSEQALDKDSEGQERYGMLVIFEKLPKAAVRHLTYFMWQQIRKTSLHHLQQVYAGGARRKQAVPEQALDIADAVEVDPQLLD